MQCCWENKDQTHEYYYQILIFILQIQFKLPCIKVYAGQYDIMVHSLPKAAVIENSGTTNFAKAGICVNGRNIFRTFFLIYVSVVT